jgi:hypothetical protein
MISSSCRKAERISKTSLGQADGRDLSSDNVRGEPNFHLARYFRYRSIGGAFALQRSDRKSSKALELSGISSPRIFGKLRSIRLFDSFNVMLRTASGLSVFRDGAG